MIMEEENEGVWSHTSRQAILKGITFYRILRINQKLPYGFYGKACIEKLTKYIIDTLLLE